MNAVDVCEVVERNVIGRCGNRLVPNVLEFTCRWILGVVLEVKEDGTVHFFLFTPVA